MTRVFPGIFMIAGWCLLLFAGSPELFGLLAVCGAALGLHEYFRMLYPQHKPLPRLLMGLPCLVPALAACFGKIELMPCAVMLSLFLLVAVSLCRYGELANPGAYLSSAVFASVYIALGIGHWTLIRFQPQGEYWLLMLAAVVAGSDTGAYYMGRALGKRKLFPRISPKKTLAGGIGGLLAGVLAAEVLNLFILHADPLILFFAALLLVAVGIAGDLTESVLKRSVGVKDSGSILMGHGGLLDRIDSMLLAGPVLYYLLSFGILR